MNNTDDASDQDLYRIGTVAALTGIAVERLRAWERRHALAPAFKSGRTRYYSKAQVDQLGLIKRLLDQGHPISSLASLSAEQLQARLSDNSASNQVVPVIAPKVGLIGSGPIVLEPQDGTGKRVDINARWANLEALLDDTASAAQCQVIVAQIPVLNIQTIDLINDFAPGASVITLYQFATADALEAFNEAQLQAAKWPVTWQEIEHMVVVAQGAAEEAQGIAARQFHDEELIAMAMSTEDPSQRLPQLIELLQQTNAFIGFAQSGESHLSTQGTLAAHLSTARAQLESALETYHSALVKHPSRADEQLTINTPRNLRQRN